MGETAVSFVDLFYGAIIALRHDEHSQGRVWRVYLQPYAMICQIGRRTEVVSVHEGVRAGAAEFLL